METLNSTPVLSIVTPCYNEEGNINVFISRVTDVVAPLGISYEIIIVDDGSFDNTWNLISASCENNVNIRGLRLSRNFGHQNALLAGLADAKGEVIISLDGDLQHPPELIPKMIKLWREGYAIVQTLRRDKDVAGPFKKLTSNLFYKVFSALTDVSIAEGSSDFRLVERRVLDQILHFRDTDLFLRGSIKWVGFRTTTLAFDVEPRFSGHTKYSLIKMLRFASGAIVSFSVIPLKIGIWLGVLASLISFAELFYILIVYLSGRTVPGWASTVFIVALLFGIVFINLGIMGAYLARIHRSLQKRPYYIVEESRSGSQPIKADQ